MQYVQCNEKLRYIQKLKIFYYRHQYHLMIIRTPELDIIVLNFLHHNGVEFNLLFINC